MNTWLVICTMSIFHKMSVKSYSDVYKTYLGDYHEFPQNTKMPEMVKSVESCVETCKLSLHLYTFAATKRESECYCGNEFRTSAFAFARHKACNQRNQFCGGEDPYSVYSICLIGKHGRNCDKPCSNCQNSVPCMRHSGECYLSRCLKDSNETCDIARLLFEVNVAFNRPVKQSSDYKENNLTYPASLAVDGNSDSNFDAQSCSKTNNHERPWFYVDLEAKRNIGKIVITHKKDHAAAAFRRYRITVFLSNFPTPPHLLDYLCGHLVVQDNAERSSIDCSASYRSFRYIFVSISSKEYLTICEIEAYIKVKDLNDCEINENSYHLNNYGIKCDCNNGYSRENIYSTCVDVDECTRNYHLCDPTSTVCTNFEGFYECNCKSGFERYNSTMCHDIDECKNNVYNKLTSQCVNTLGSYKIRCKEGFRKENDEGNCKDIDECMEWDRDPDVGCHNLEGGYIFSCPKGLYLEEQHSKLFCAAPSNAGSIAAGILSVIAIVLAILLVLWKRLNQVEIKSLNKTGKENWHRGNISFLTNRGHTKTNSRLEDDYTAISEKDSGFQKQFQNLLRKSTEEIEDALPCKEITRPSDEWKVYSADGLRIPDKYIFANFPSESDVDKFWEICMKSVNVILLFDSIKDGDVAFLPSITNSLTSKQLKLELTNSMKAGYLTLQSVSATLEDDDGYDKIKMKETQFSVIRVHSRNNDFLTIELFKAVKGQSDLLSYNSYSEECAFSVFVLSRDDLRLASFYVTCCKLFDQIELDKRENEYLKLFEILN